MKRLKYTVQIGTLESLVQQTVLALNQVTNITADYNIGNVNTIITINYPKNYTDLEVLQLGITIGTILYPNYNLPKI